MGVQREKEEHELVNIMHYKILDIKEQQIELVMRTVAVLICGIHLHQSLYETFLHL
jgi:hypothetical protein